MFAPFPPRDVRWGSWSCVSSSSTTVVFSHGLCSVCPVHRIKECHKLPCKPHLTFQNKIATVLDLLFSNSVGPSLVPFVIGMRKPEFLTSNRTSV